MQDYVRSGIRILNDVTKDLEDLNGLGIYLSKQTNIDALKTLKLMVLSHQTGRINKKFDINAINTYTYLKEENTGIEHTQQENIIGNLSMNPQNFALEFMEYISKNYPINYNFRCYGTYTILGNWLRSFKLMDFHDEDMFYKRYDMIDKKMDILEFLINNGFINRTQIQSVMDTYKEILEVDNKFNKEQLERMKYTLETMELYYIFHHKTSYSKKLSKDEKIKEHDFIDRKFDIYRKPNKEVFKNAQKNAEKELQDYRMRNDQCVYMLYEIPKLIESKVLTIK